MARRSGRRPGPPREAGRRDEAPAVGRRDRPRPPEGATPGTPAGGPGRLANPPRSAGGPDGVGRSEGNGAGAAAPRSPRSQTEVAADPAADGSTDERLPASGNAASRGGATAAQMRRFIKSRSWVPMHELRRRFGIEGNDDDVVGIEIDGGRRIFVGLPPREGDQLGELLRSGDVGYELSLDPVTPVVIGVYPMRPVMR